MKLIISNLNSQLTDSKILFPFFPDHVCNLSVVLGVEKRDERGSQKTNECGHQQQKRGEVVAFHIRTVFGADLQIKISENKY